MIAPVRERRGIPLRAVVPNAVTALALCSGLSGVRFAIASDWEKAVAAIAIAAVLDGMDGRIARMLKGQSRFGAELDSLSDVIAFGVSPAIIMHLWALQYLPRFGWLFALAYAVCAALRLARFNAAIDVEEQPHKSAGFLTGVPAPAGAGLMLLPLLLWIASDRQWDWLQTPAAVAGWAALSAFLMISSVATYSWSSLRIRRSSRLFAIAGIGLLGAALVTSPWVTLLAIAGIGLLGAALVTSPWVILLAISVIYVAMLPFSIASYDGVRRRRGSGAGHATSAVAGRAD